MNVHGLILPARILGVFILLMAVIPISIGLWLYSRTTAFFSGAVETTGAVVHVMPDQGSNGTMYRSVAEFQDDSGTIHRITSDWSSNPPAHSIGQRVKVFYKPENPANARIEGSFSSWLFPLMCAGMAFMVFLVSMVFIWFIPFTIRRVWPKPAVQ